MDGPVQQTLLILLASLRLAPLIAFTPPFTLVKIPATVRAVIVVALAVGFTQGAGRAPSDVGEFAVAAASELALGLAIALPLPLAFGLIGMAARMLDVQAGFGLAFLLDPKTNAQMPLIGALFTYAAGAMFFLTSGPADLIAVIAMVFATIPVGMAVVTAEVGPLLAFMGAAAVISLGVVGLTMIALFLIDLVIAMMSRTLPQMNVLVLGFQVKALATLLLLPLTLGVAGAGILKLIRLALETMSRMQ